MTPKHKLKVRLAERDGWVCHYCGKELKHIFDVVKSGPKYNEVEGYPVIEHKVPRSLGGSNHMENLVLACWHCDQEKGLTPYEEFKGSKGQK